MGINIGDAPPYKSRHIDFHRVALLRGRLEEIATELGFSVERFTVEENLIDGLDRLPMVSIEIEQRWKRPTP